MCCSLELGGRCEAASPDTVVWRPVPLPRSTVNGTAMMHLAVVRCMGLGGARSIGSVAYRLHCCSWVAAHIAPLQKVSVKIASGALLATGRAGPFESSVC